MHQIGARRPIEYVDRDSSSERDNAESALSESAVQENFSDGLPFNIDEKPGTSKQNSSNGRQCSTELWLEEEDKKKFF